MDNVTLFSDITGMTEAVAEGYLRMAEGNLESAVQLYYDNPELHHSFNAANNLSNNSQPRPRAALHEDEDGVIHLDDSDEEASDIDMNNDFDAINQDDDHIIASRIAAQAQADEDAAMAKKLQEELYAENGAQDPSHDIRAPIASRTETLVGGWDDYDEDSTEMNFLAEMDRRRRARQAASSNPFSQSIWEDSHSNPIPTRDPETGQSASRSQRLAQLFRPPFDLMARLSWEDARDEGKEKKKWLLVNLQDMSNFHCQALNRDIWRDQAVKDLIQEHFIFLQYAKDDINAEQYITFYFPGQQHENQDLYPHVSIIDPRTGEQVKIWSGTPFPSSSEFYSQLVEFLDRYSLSANSKNPVAKKANKSSAPDFDRMTEEEMLEMALMNSLGESKEGDPAASAAPAIVDPDSLTRLDTPEAPPAPELSAWDNIASDQPHVEPENNPAMVTRIQFRHASGRVIRRFSLEDRVERLYQWLKAEPLEGNAAGAEFELKQMPQGKDLIGLLDQTIADAGLKQGTVMVEYI
ncbi:UBX domain-containing protein 5 [Ceratocystis platani]|uniref:UBX domain-containing protein 5 n=1 Tax=Ceratocystis fimbriata f. sp. platani TaxID=88771 RepID=A0A0F8AZJ8_CERFI|nr:UBX domain-containing protein 5 [Ceratocystis platani]